MHIMTHYTIMKVKDPMSASLLALPLLYGMTFAMMSYLTLLKAPLTKSLVDGTTNAIISVLVFFAVGLGAHLVVVPQMREMVEEEERKAEDDRISSSTIGRRDMHTAQETLQRMSSISTRRGVASLLGSSSGLQVGSGTQVELTNIHKPAQEDEQGLVLFTQNPPTPNQAPRTSRPPRPTPTSAASHP